MRRARSLVAALGLTAALSPGVAQVVSPPEILDVQLRELQQKHMSDLKRVATEISAHSFPYRLYFSRTLNLSEEQQKRSDQRSIRFDKFRDQTVLEITANYYASYSADLMDREERAGCTLHDVALPMLEAAIPALAGEEQLQSFAVEISQHVRRKVLGVTDENSENVAFILPAGAAKQLIAATTSGEREAALLHGQLFVNRQPLERWGIADPPLTETKHSSPAISIPQPAESHVAGSELPSGAVAGTPAQTANALTITPALTPGRLAVGTPAEVSADSLRSLQQSQQADLERLVGELDKEAHFVSYAPPVFIAFHKGAFLQLSMVTTLKETAVASQYHLAALAFDEHIAHLIRPVLAYFKGMPGFDGFDFSTTVRLAGTAEGAGVAVEFIFPASALVSYQNYDLTGQQLINTGFVLINGERVTLELQTAEAGFVPQR